MRGGPTADRPRAEAPRARLGDRALFPQLEARVYANHAAISPPSSPVRAAVNAVLDDYARRGVGAVGAWVEQRQRLRGKLAALVGGDAADIGYVPNTTRGVTDVALCFPWKPGDRILLYEGEFPANVTPWQRAAARFGLTIDWATVSPFERSLEEGLADLDARLTRDRPRLVATSFVRFQTGLRLPVEAMAARCHEAGAELFVDAIQGLGVVPAEGFAAAGVDYVSCGGHKWLMGLEGLGFLWVRPSRVDALRPDVAGWLSHDEPVSFLFEGAGHLRHDRPIRKRADFVEGGVTNHLGAAALEAAVDLLGHVGVARVLDHVNAWHDRLEPALVERGFASARHPDPALRSGSLCVRPPAGVDLLALHRGLGARGVACTTPDGWLRFSPHWPNDPAEVVDVLAAVDAGLGDARR